MATKKKRLFYKAIESETGEYLNIPWTEMQQVKRVSTNRQSQIKRVLPELSSSAHKVAPNKKTIVTV